MRQQDLAPGWGYALGIAPPCLLPAFLPPTDTQHEGIHLMPSQIERLIDIMARLRDPERGCPWDVEQNFTTIAPHTLEEAYEVADAIERQDLAAGDRIRGLQPNPEFRPVLGVSGSPIADSLTTRGA